MWKTFILQIKEVIFLIILNTSSHILHYYLYFNHSIILVYRPHQPVCVHGQCRWKWNSPSHLSFLAPVWTTLLGGGSGKQTWRGGNKEKVPFNTQVSMRKSNTLSIISDGQSTACVWSGHGWQSTLKSNGVMMGCQGRGWLWE